MKKTIVMLFALVSFCACVFAADADSAKVAKDYDILFGGPNATVEMTEGRVMAAVAHLKIYGTPERSVVVPKALKNYKIIRAGKGDAYLIIPHFAKTRMIARETASRKKDGALTGLLEGKTLVLFCNKGETIVDMLVRNGNGGIQLVSFEPDAEPQREDGQPGSVIIPTNQQGLLVDITQEIGHDGNLINVE